MRLKRVISAALAVSMAVSMMPATAVSAFATDVGNSVAVQTAEDSKTTNNSCGKTTADSVTWDFDQTTGTLTISGTGDMADYTSESQQPWYSNANNIEKIVINEGVKSIGAQSFRALSNVKQVTLADSVESIGDMAFRNTGVNATEALILHLGKNVSSISTDALRGNKFAAFIVDEENTSFMASADGLLYSKDGKKLISYPMRKAGTTFNNAWLDGVEVIGTRAFFGARFDGPSDIVIPETVKVVGAQAFSNTFNLNNAVFVLHLPNSLEKLEYAAFFAGRYQGVLKLGKNLTTIVTTDGSAVNGALYDGHNYKGAIDATEINPNIQGEITHVKTGCKMVVYVKDAAQKEAASNVIYSGLITNWAFTNGGSFAENTTFEEGKLATPEKAGYTFAGWYENADFTGEAVKTPETGKTYYAKWKVIPVAATMTATTSKSDYLVNTPVDVNIAIAPGTDMYKILNGSVTFTYGDEVEKVELNGKELTEKEYTVQELAQMMKLTSRSSDIKATLNVTYKKVGKFDFNVALKDANGAQICADGTQVVVAEEAAELTPATKLYTLTVKNADVTIKNGDEEIKAEKNDKGELIAKVPEKADVTVTYTSQSDAVAFDQWTITTDETLDVDVKNNPLKFQMPAGGVTIEAMTKDASIEEDEPNILGTTAVVGTAAVGTAILAWQGYQLGTELYLKTALPAGTAIPTNRAELALLVWNHAGKPAPAAVLPADATDTQKAIAWAVENDLLKAAKDNGETYVDTDSVSRVEVIRVWNKAQEK
ncbi:MAG: leucine-rich repeat protein [Faecalibacterium sp.]